MAKPTLKSLEERIEALEKKLAEQSAPQPSVPVKDWRRSIGMYSDSEMAELIEAEGRAIREADHEAGRRGEVE